MSTKLIQIYKKFQNKWVAFNNKRNQVLAWGSSIQEVENKLKRQKQSAYEIKYILPLDKKFAP